MKENGIISNCQKCSLTDFQCFLDVFIPDYGIYIDNERHP